MSQVVTVNDTADISGSETPAPPAPPAARKSSGRTGRILLTVVLLAAVAGTVWRMRSSEAPFLASKAPKVAYPTAVAQKKPFELRVEAGGTVDSSRKAELSSDVRGMTTIISLVPAGSHVQDPFVAKKSGVVASVLEPTSDRAVVEVEDESGRIDRYVIEPMNEYTRVIVNEGQPVRKGQILAGDVVCELDASELIDTEKEQQIRVTQAYAALETARANVEIQIARNESRLAAAQLSADLSQLELDKYEQGQFPQQQEQIIGDLEKMRENLSRAQESYDYTRRLSRKGYKGRDEVDQKRLAVLDAQLKLDSKERALDVLENFAFERTITELKERAINSVRQVKRVQLAGEAALAQVKAIAASREMSYNIQLKRLQYYQDQIAACTLVAPQAGQVVYAQQPSGGSQWTPVEVGMSVRPRQTLINLPDMDSLIVETQIHESLFSQIDVGQPALVEVDGVAGVVYQGVVDTLSSVPHPGRWPNNHVKFYHAEVRIVASGDTLHRLKPGMSGAVAIIADQSNAPVLQVPVEAVVGTAGRSFAWVMTDRGPESRELELGNSNDSNFVVEAGLAEGDVVVLHPRDYFAEEIETLESSLDAPSMAAEWDIAERAAAPKPEPEAPTAEPRPAAQLAAARSNNDHTAAD